MHIEQSSPILSMETEFIRWVPVSLTDKVSYRRVRNLGSNPVICSNIIVTN
jgi:hypothetical protein